MIKPIAKPFAQVSPLSNKEPLIIAFEGTGPGTDGTAHFPGGFMDQVRSKLGGAYIFGPDMFNAISLMVMADARAALRNRLRGYDSRPVILIGWSRGGAAAIHLAREMADGRNFDKCLTVEALILLDAVDRSPLLYTSDAIPGNVLNCYHAYRDPGVGSRPMFGNTGMRWEGHPEFKPEKFWATHAAFGGLPGTFGGIPFWDDTPSSKSFKTIVRNPSMPRCWDSVYTDTTISCVEDVAAARRIAKWMSACFARHGILSDFAPIVPAHCPGPSKREIVEKCTYGNTD